MKFLSLDPKARLSLIVICSLILTFPIVRFLDKGLAKVKVTDETEEILKSKENDNNQKIPVESKKVFKDSLEQLAYQLTEFANERWTDSTHFSEDGIIYSYTPKTTLEVTYNISEVSLGFNNSNVSCDCNNGSRCIKIKRQSDKNLLPIESTSTSWGFEGRSCKKCTEHTMYALFQTLQEYKKAVEKKLLQ